MDTSSEKMLLTKMKEIEDSKILTRNKWKTISTEVNKHNFNFSPEQCRLKVQCIKEKFERKKKKMNTSGELPASTESDDLEDIFETFPDSNQNCIIDSGAQKELSSKQKAKEMKGAVSVSPVTSDESSLEEPRIVTDVKRPRRSVDVMKDLIMQISKNREDAAERRHNEKLETVNSLIDVLKEVAKK